MTIATTFSRRLALDYPIVLAPMGGVSGGRLAAAVSEAGGLGLVGGGYGDLVWLREQLSLAREGTRRSWGVGLIAWTLVPEVLQLALSFKPAVVMLSFGDFSKWAPEIKGNGSLLMCQVQDEASAAAAIAAGADFIVAQGAEAGGHAGSRATFPLVPAVLDLAGSIPVLAAGGIADGRGVAAALVLGAQAAVLGTRFYASPEALGSDRLKAVLASSRGSETVKTCAFDVLRGRHWPPQFSGRAIRNDFVRTWNDRLPELAARTRDAMPLFLEAQAAGDPSQAMIWAGECVDLIKSVEPAATLVHDIGQQAEAQLRLCHAILDDPCL